MTQFRDISVAGENTTLAEIEAAVDESGGFLASFGFGFDCPKSPTIEVPGWKVMLVDKRGMGNHGCYIAVATTPETFERQKAATLRIIRERADEMERLASLADTDDLPYPEEPPPPPPYKASGDYAVERNAVALRARVAFRERGDFASMVVPLFFSPLFSFRKRFAFADDKWAYFAHENSNFLRVGDDSYRLWCRPAAR